MRHFITSLTKLIELAGLIIHLVTNKPDFGWPSSLYIAVLFFPWFFTLMFYFLVCIGYLEKCYKSSSFQVQNYEITSNLEHYKSYWPSRNQFVGGIGDSRLCLYFRWRICYQWCLGFSYTSPSNNLLYRPNKPLLCNNMWYHPDMIDLCGMVVCDMNKTKWTYLAFVTHDT